jgi:hypothetical protein
MTSDIADTRCDSLKDVCPDYVYVAVYAPKWPKDQEFYFSCSSLYYAPLPVGLSVALTIVLGIIYCILRRRIDANNSNTNGVTMFYFNFTSLILKVKTSRLKFINNFTRTLRNLH